MSWRFFETDTEGSLFSSPNTALPSLFKVCQLLYKLQEISFMKCTWGIGVSKYSLSIFWATIVSTTILYWTNIILSKVAGQPQDNMLPAGFSMSESAFDKWARKPETKAKIAAVKKSAWSQFTKQFSNADKNQFFVQTSVDDKWNVTAEVFFNEAQGSSQSVFGSDRKYWNQQMKTAPGLISVAGFPFQLSPLKTKRALPISAVDFTEAAPSLAKIFNEEKRIYATPDEFFVAKFCNIFQQTRLTHTASAEAKTWLGGPNTKYWPQS